MAEYDNASGSVINPDVKLAFDCIKNKRAVYDLLYNYYKGLHPLKYSASRLKKAFEKIDTYFAENWVAVIVDSVLDRLVLRGFDIAENTEANDKLEEIFKVYNLALEADDVHEAAVITGEAFLIATQNSDAEDEDDKYDIYFNDPRMCHMFYESSNPRKKRFAAKIYVGDDGYSRLVLYYSDRYEYYKSDKKAGKINQDIFQTYANFKPDDELPLEANDTGEIPVFHFSIGRTSKRKDLGPSEISLQDAINKLLTDMLVSAEFNAFVQRVIISQADPGDLQNIAGANWWIPAGDGKGQQSTVQELGGRSLDQFLKAINDLATALAIISRTPKHYFFAQGGDPSGEALIAMESPLNKKVNKRMRAFSVEWNNFARYILTLEKIKIMKTQITPLWEPVETVQPATSANILKTNTDAGVPLVTAMRWQGKPQSDIDQMLNDKKDEKKTMTGLAQDALDKLRAEDAQNNTPIDQAALLRQQQQQNAPGTPRTNGAA